MEYEKCLVELDEILNYLNKEEFIKIPKEIISGIKEKKDKNYNWIYDNTKDFYNQNIDRRTIAMLSYINMKYLLDDSQRKIMEELHKMNEYKQEEIKKKQYNSDKLFENRKTYNKSRTNYERINNKEEMLPTIIKEEKWYKKIFRILKNILYINRK